MRRVVLVAAAAVRQVHAANGICHVVHLLMRRHGFDAVIDVVKCPSSSIKPPIRRPIDDAPVGHRSSSRSRT